MVVAACWKSSSALQIFHSHNNWLAGIDTLHLSLAEEIHHVDDSLLNIPKARSTMEQKTFQYSAAKDWNRLPKEFRDITNFEYFKTELLKYLFNAEKASHQCSVVNY